MIVPTQSRPGAVVRPRYGRIAALGLSLVVSGVALLGSVGLLPSSAAATDVQAARDVSATTPLVPAGGASRPGDPSGNSSADASVGPPTAIDPLTLARRVAEALPAHSGTGRRVVFDQSDQRVWLVGGHSDRVRRTYLVSGSLTDNLQPGSYEVYSRQIHAIGIDDSGTMTHFVVFTQGPTGAAIGFHDIPRLHGSQVQTQGQLGTPRSHGCIRQAEADARALWKFAPTGTPVVVTA